MEVSSRKAETVYQETQTFRKITRPDARDWMVGRGEK